MLDDPGKLELLNRKIAATADQIAHQRELIERCRQEGKGAEQLEAALDALSRLFQRLLKERGGASAPGVKG